MIKIVDKQKCCGCSACMQSCPQKCIKMKIDNEGFWYPNIDENECVNCGRCERVCPILNHKDGKTDVPPDIVQAFSAYFNEEQIRLSSSSGGLFTAIAQHILSEQGVVFGAAFDDDFMVHHIAVDTMEGLVKFRGSKYTQSRIENTYQEAKQYLERGIQVLYSGTACQIAGLKTYLNKEYDNLLTVDVLCHGVPSPKVWETYIDDQSKVHESKIIGINFRNKTTGWKTYSMQVLFENGFEYKQIFYNDAFMRLFLSNICLRPSCHDCLFKGFPRVSDITLGDCWGVEQHSPEMDDNKGTSVIIINSQKGEKMRATMWNECTWKQSELNTVLPVNADSRKSVLAHKNRIKMFVKMNMGGYS